MELEKLQEQIQQEWTEMKSIMDKRDEEVKKFGYETGQTKEALDKVNEVLSNLEKELKSRLDELETKSNRPGNSGSENEEAETKAAFMKYCRKGDKALLADEVKSLTVGDDTQAGYLAPAEYVREIIKDIVLYSPIRNYARIRQTNSESIQIPKRTGTFAAAWVSETGTKAETKGLSYGLEELSTHEMYAFVDISNKMLEDSAFDLEAELRMEFAEQFGVAEGTAFVSGNGVGKPEGILTNADVTAVNSGAAADLTADGLIDLAYTLPSAYAANARWALRRATIGKLRQLKDGTGNYLCQPGIGNDAPPTILGMPYFEASDMPAVSAGTYPIVLGDFSRGYTIVDRISISVLRDPFTQATTGKVRFIARKRVGGQVVLAEAFVKQLVSA